MDKAIALQPEDPRSHFLLGRWCYQVSSRHPVSSKVLSVSPGLISSESFMLLVDDPVVCSPDWPQTNLSASASYVLVVNDVSRYCF